MRRRKTILVLTTLAMTSLNCIVASADANLQITELWAGGLPGANTTSDWFELTNFGDAPATNLNGTLYYDDNSDDPAASDPLVGIDTIAPGESVIYLVAWENPFNSVRADAIAAFVSMWEPLANTQIGVVNFGGGLGADGDAVNIFDGNMADAATIDRAAYTAPVAEPSFVSEADGTWLPRIAQVDLLAARAGNHPADDLAAGPPIGSPGVVPEPSSLFILSVGLLAWLAASGRRGMRLMLGLALAFVVTIPNGECSAEANLQITEVWPGALPGTEFTSDWFEVTNFGDTAAIGLNGNLYFDDGSDDPTASDAMVGIDSIAPGESVIYLTTWEDGFNNVLDDAVAAFVTMWQPSTDLQVGSVTLGSGFGGDGDAANIFAGNTAGAIVVDRVEYAGPAMSVESFISNADGSWIPKRAQVGVLGAYAGYQPADDSSPNPAVGSPGIVPEPTSFALISWAMVIICLRRAQRSDTCAAR